jgi:hypothetical protein
MNRSDPKLYGSLPSSVYTVCTRAKRPFTATLLPESIFHVLTYMSVVIRYAVRRILSLRIVIDGIEF